MSEKEEIAALRAKVEELEAKVSPPKSTFVPMSDAEWIDRMHQMRERRMSLATPPSVRQYFADGVTAADCADINRAAHAPQGPSSQGAIPSSQQASNVHTGGSVSGTGWVDPRPLGPQPGIDLIDRAVNAQSPTRCHRQPWWQVRHHGVRAE